MGLNYYKVYYIIIIIKLLSKYSQLILMPIIILLKYLYNINNKYV